MSRLYAPVLVIHVIVAVLGLGSIASIAVVAAAARKTGRGMAEVSAWLSPLLRYSVFSLAAMLVTGVLLDLAAGGAFHHLWWFRGSALLLIPIGALHSQARRAVRAGLAHQGAGIAALRKVERIAYGMCALVAVIVVLMELKPF
jgi:hypothetical protein